MYVCMYVCTHVCMHACMYVCRYVYDIDDLLWLCLSSADAVCCRRRKNPRKNQTCFLETPWSSLAGAFQCLVRSL